MDDELIVALAVISDAPGAMYPRGTQVRKVNSQPGDANPDGTLGRVMGSMGPALPSPELPAHLVGTYAYFVDWAGSGIPVAVVGHKLEAYHDA